MLTRTTSRTLTSMQLPILRVRLPACIAGNRHCVMLASVHDTLATTYRIAKL